jgi:hypothetical protein
MTPFANAGGAVLPEDTGPADIDALDSQIRDAAAELREREPAEERTGKHADEDLDATIRDAATECRQREQLESLASQARVQPDIATQIAQRNAERAAEMWHATDPEGAQACLASADGTAVWRGLNPERDGPALVASYQLGQRLAAVGAEIDKFRLQHKLTDSAMAKMAEAINDGHATDLQSAYDFICPRGLAGPIAEQQWRDERLAALGPVHLFAVTDTPEPPNPNPWGFSEPKKRSA